MFPGQDRRAHNVSVIELPIPTVHCNVAMPRLHAGGESGNVTRCDEACQAFDHESGISKIVLCSVIGRSFRDPSSSTSMAVRATRSNGRVSRPGIRPIESAGGQIRTRKETDHKPICLAQAATARRERWFASESCNGRGLPYRVAARH